MRSNIAIIYDVTLQYSTGNNSTSSPSRRRSRNIIWNIIQQNSQNKRRSNFPSSHRQAFSTQKPTPQSLTQRIRKTSTVPKPKEYDCRKANVCPLNEKCLTSNVVYKAEITTPHDGTTKEYIGMTSTEFKVRYRNHKKSFKVTSHDERAF